MEKAVQHLELLIEKAGDLASTKVKIWKLKTASKVSKKLSVFVAAGIGLLCVGAAFLTISIGAAFWIGSLLHNTSAGFFIMGGFFLVTGLLFFIFRKRWFRTMGHNTIARMLVNDEQ